MTGTPLVEMSRLTHPFRSRAGRLRRTREPPGGNFREPPGAFLATVGKAFAGALLLAALLQMASAVSAQGLGDDLIPVVASDGQDS